MLRSGLPLSRLWSGNPHRDWARSRWQHRSGRTRRGTGLFGPYIDLPPGRYDAKILLAPDRPLSGRAVMDIAVSCGEKRLAEKNISLPAAGSEGFHLRFEMSGDDRGVEVRLMCELGFKATLTGVEIKPSLAERRPQPELMFGASLALRVKHGTRSGSLKQRNCPRDCNLKFCDSRKHSIRE